MSLHKYRKIETIDNIAPAFRCRASQPNEATLIFWVKQALSQTQQLSSSPVIPKLSQELSINVTASDRDAQSFGEALNAATNIIDVPEKNEETLMVQSSCNARAASSDGLQPSKDKVSSQSPQRFTSTPPTRNATAGEGARTETPQKQKHLSQVLSEKKGSESTIAKSHLSTPSRYPPNTEGGSVVHPSPEASPYVHSLMPVLKTVLEGHLGPVALDVQLVGNVGLIHDPHGFEKTLESYEDSSSGTLQPLLSTIRLYVMARGMHVYVLDSENQAVLPSIAALLMAPAVRKIILHAPLLYRLLFFFLGTDRLDISNVVDLTAWSVVMQQRCAQPHGGAAMKKGLHVGDTWGVEHVWHALEESTRQLIEAHFSNSFPISGETFSHNSTSNEVVAKGKSLRASRTLQEVSSASDLQASGQDPINVERIVRRSLGEKDTVGNPSRHQANETAADPPTAPAPGNGMKNAIPGKVFTRHTFAYHQVDRQSTCLFSDRVMCRELASVFMYYDEALQPYENAGIGGADVPSPSVGTLLTMWDLCDRLTYTTFLCALMSYHGVFLNRDRFEAFLSNLEAQQEEILQTAESCWSALRCSTPAVGLSQDSPGRTAPIRPAGVALNVPMDSVEARKLVELLCEHLPLTIAEGLKRVGTSLPHGAPSKGRPSENIPSETLHVTNFLQHLRKLLTPGVESGGEQESLLFALRNAICLCECWLALRERQASEKVLLNMFKAGSTLVRGRVLYGDMPCSGGGGGPSQQVGVAYVVHPRWVVHGAATGRLFAAAPNVQTIPKKPPRARYALPRVPAAHEAQGHSTGLPETEEEKAGGRLLFKAQPRWNLRCLYCAPPGCGLVSLDFNQIELRVLAHLSRDGTLLEQLESRCDVLALIARTVYGLSPTEPVQEMQRQSTKIIVYGLLYGMGTKQMDHQLHIMRGASLKCVPVSMVVDPVEEIPEPLEQEAAEDGGILDHFQESFASTITASDLIKSFYEAYPRVRHYLLHTRQQALHNKTVVTLSGVRTLFDQPEHAKRRQMSVALAIQGGAADLLQAAMRAIHQQRHELVPFFPVSPIALVMAIHDELIYAVPTGVIPIVVPQLKRIMEAQGQALGLTVPLCVSVKVGSNMGELEEMEC